MNLIPQNTDFLRLFYFGQTHTGDTNLNVKYSKNGAAFIDPPEGGGGSWRLSEIGLGWYYFALSVAWADTDTLGPLAYSFQNGAPLETVGDTPIDMIVPASAPSDDWAVPLPGAYTAGQAGFILGNLAGGALSLGTIIESTYTLQDVLRVMVAVLGGTSSVAGPIAIFRSLDGTKNRVTVTIAAGGQRSSVTFDLT
jgi:hypothetical protein